MLFTHESCKIDDIAMPMIINDIKYADFRKSFEIGFDQLCNGIRIKEEIVLQNNIQLKQFLKN